MTGPTKPQGDFCLTPGFTARDKRTEWCGGGGRGEDSLCPLRSILCPFLVCTPLTSPAPSSPIVPFCAARCRLGEDRLLKRTWSRVRSQGAGVRATQGSPGTFIDSMGTRGQRVAGAGPTSQGPGCASTHSDCRTVSLANAPNALSMHTEWKPVRIWTFHSDSSSLET